MNLFRFLCINCDRETFQGLPSLTWERSGLVRWLFAEPNAGDLEQELEGADQIILDWSPSRREGANKVWQKLRDYHGYEVWHFSEAPTRIPDEIEGRLLLLKDLEKRIGQLELPGARSPITWPRLNPHMAKLNDELASSLPLILEKYLPHRTKRATVYQVTDGWSGNPMLRLAVDDHQPQYFLKCFGDPKEFVREWEAHKLAVEWLPENVVRVCSVPEIPEEGRAQLEVFLTRSERHYPICYESAHITATLKDLYTFRPRRFVRAAYRMILECLTPSQLSLERTVPLSDLPDCGPPIALCEADSILEALRSPGYQSFIRTAIARVSRYGQRMLSASKWRAMLHSLEQVLGPAPPQWITEPCKINYGPIYGDANARNFLFDRTAESPNELQIIDCGGFQQQGPLVFDLAQLESDVKFVLMRTDEQAEDYLDIDTGRLSEVTRIEAKSIEEAFAFSADKIVNPSLKTTYRVVDQIRDRACGVSDNDPMGRAFYFCLLYWTLRKTRISNLPHVKCLLALYSACKICSHMEAWGPR